MSGRSCVPDRMMIRNGAILLLAVSGAAGFPLKLGPAVRYMILDGGQLHGMDCISYEESTSRLLFCDETLLLPGVVVEINLTQDMNANLRYLWCSYNPYPCSFIAPDSSLHSLDRMGSISIFELGLRKNVGDFYLLPGLELQRFREEWTDPFDGVQHSLDSTTVGPSLVVGTSMDWSPVELGMEMGLVLPSLDDVQGRITLLLLAP